MKFGNWAGKLSTANSECTSDYAPHRCQNEFSVRVPVFQFQLHTQIVNFTNGGHAANWLSGCTQIGLIARVASLE